MIAKQARATLIPLGLYWASMIITLLLFILLSRAAVAFQCSAPRSPLRYRTSSVASELLASTNDDVNVDDATVAVKAADLDEALGLSPEERTVVNVHRICSPSVVYVTSVLKSMGGSASSASGRSTRWRRRRSKAKSQEEGDDDNGEQQQNKQKLPRGTTLGSGSGFVVDSQGYIVTNYHVIQRAYEANQAMIRYDNFWDGLAKNATKRMKDSFEPFGGDSDAMDDLEGFINDTVSAISGTNTSVDGVLSSTLPAQVFVRFGDGTDATSSDGSGASYHPCEIVDVRKEIDVAVLKISNPLPSLKALPYGSSSDLLVGQSLLAIGNPFGLDRTITSGLVSAIGRSVTGVAGNEIKNCIQTDAAINPGNSGGPLLNKNGEVVGVNTMIITTSGSSAGIGFAVPGDKVKESADSIVELDKERQLRNAKRKGRGYLGVEVATSSLEESLRQRLVGSRAGADEGGIGVFVTSIAADSPLLQDGIDTASVAQGNVHLGERIINVGGNSIENGREFVSEMKKRVEGEQLSLTVENVQGEKRVLYVTLGRIPL